MGSSANARSPPVRHSIPTGRQSHQAGGPTDRAYGLAFIFSNPNAHLMPPKMCFW